MKSQKKTFIINRFLILCLFFILVLSDSSFSFSSINPVAVPVTEAKKDAERTDRKEPYEKGTEEETEVLLNAAFLDVGQGLSVLLESDGHYLLYDGGGPDYSSYLVSYLTKTLGIRKLDYIVASHYDADHISGLIGVLNTLDVDIVIGPDYIGDTHTYESFMDMLDRKGISLTKVLPGDTFPLGFSVFAVLAPLQDAEYENNRSIVIRVVCRDHSILLMGDAQKEEEESLLLHDLCEYPEESSETEASEFSLNDTQKQKSILSLESDILVIGHHGSASSSSQTFLDAVSPGYAVISCGADNTYGHPTHSVMERLWNLHQNSELSLYRTDLQGTISFSLTDFGYKWNTDPTADYRCHEEDNCPLIFLPRPASLLFTNHD